MNIAGNFDGLHAGVATGWAIDQHDTGKMLTIELLLGNEVVAEGRTTLDQADVAQTGRPGEHGRFTIPVPDFLYLAADSGSLALTARVQGADGILPGGPHVVSREQRFRYWIDGFVQRKLLTGWLRDEAQPDRAFTIELLEGTRVLASGRTDNPIDANSRIGRFTFTIDDELLDGEIHRFTFHCRELAWDMESRHIVTPIKSRDLDNEHPFLEAPRWAKTLSSQREQKQGQVAATSTQESKSRLLAIQAALNGAAASDAARRYELTCQLGRLYLEIGELGNSIKQFEAAINIDSDRWAAYTGYADALARLGQKGEAIQLIDSALMRLPDSVELLACQDKLRATEREKTAKVIAFYLPQFHPFRENDEWWGKGFTEWTNVAAATPAFHGHLQPRRPTALGYYDLRVPEVMAAQFELARKFGIDAFCYYYYWFDGRRVMDRPIRDMMDGKSGSFPFCICWANEDWTRSWDGLSGEVLLAQNHSVESDFRFIHDLAPVLRHPDYLRVDGKAVVLVYRAQKLADPVRTTAAWREWCRKEGIGELHLCAVQSFGFDDPRTCGFDAAVEFPPHAVHEKYPGTTYHKRLTDLPGMHGRFTGSVFDYQVFADAFLSRPREPYRLYRGCFLAWDNTARRGKNAHVFHHFSVEKYISWLARSAARTALEGDNALVFVNAWNEWAEGAVLEPDGAFGHELLEATRLAKRLMPYVAEQTYWRQGAPDMGMARLQYPHRVLIIGHDAHPHGAQINLLNLARSLKRDFAIEVVIALLEGGELQAEYEKVGETVVLGKGPGWENILSGLARHYAALGTASAICNTVVTGAAARVLRSEGFRVLCLVHELPSLIEANGLQGNCWEVASHATGIVFASSFVADRFCQRYWPEPSKVLIAPQGIAFNPLLGKRDTLRAEVRKEFNLPPDTLIVMGCGFGDVRKGIDLFVQAAGEARRRGARLAWMWVGGIEGNLETYIRADIHRLGLLDTLLITGRVANTARYYAAADIFALTSREDPFPSVVMEAMDAGLPVVAFAEGGGYSDIVNDDTGALVPYLSVQAMADAVCALAADEGRRERIGTHAHQFCRATFSYRSYNSKLLALMMSVPVELVAKGVLSRAEIPTRAMRISALIPNYNYSRYLELRLRTVADQTVAPCEIIVLDDASTDDSIVVIERFRQTSQIPVRLIRNETNSGNPFVQWARGIEQAVGDLIWIAEADDYCEPTLLEQLAPRFDEESVVLAWSDSIMVDENGAGAGAEYKDYFAKEFGPCWDSDFDMDGRRLIEHSLAYANVVPNASAALFRRAAVRDLALIQQYRFSGDWWFWIDLAEKGLVSYHARALNYHRRHSRSVMGGVLSDGSRLMSETLAFYRRLALQKPGLMSPQVRIKIFHHLEKMYRLFAHFEEKSAQLKNHPDFATGYRELVALLKPADALKELDHRRSARVILSDDILDSSYTSSVLATLADQHAINVVLLGTREGADRLVKDMPDILPTMALIKRGERGGALAFEPGETVYAFGLEALTFVVDVPSVSEVNLHVLAGQEFDALMGRGPGPEVCMKAVTAAINMAVAACYVTETPPHAYQRLMSAARKPVMRHELRKKRRARLARDKEKRTLVLPAHTAQPHEWAEVARRLRSRAAREENVPSLQLLVTNDEAVKLAPHLKEFDNIDLVWIYEQPRMELIDGS